jgi:hypothetical protein
MLPDVLITESCWARVCDELDRVLPSEGLAVPLVWLKRRMPDPGPTALLRLDQIERVVVATAVLVPPELQMNAGFRVGVLARTDERIAGATRSLIRRHPRLRACAHLHSHPFARGQTRPSRGATCDYEGHMLPLLSRNREAGLAASFSFIACRALGGDGWALHCFALDEWGDIVDLGPASRIADSHPDAAAPFMPALPRRPVFRLVRAWLGALARRGIEHRLDELFDGWLRIIVHPIEQTSLVVLLPLAFPRSDAQLFVWDRVANATHRLEVEPAALDRASSLLRICRTLTEVDHGNASGLLPESAPVDRGGA